MTDYILVVDDEPDLKHFIELVFKRKIRKKEYHFSFALNGMEALDRLKANPEIGLVLTDLNMPEMDGITLLGKIKEMNAIIKPVIISAYGDMANIRSAMNRGAHDFLTKPINLKDLEITVTNTLKEISILKQALESREALIALEKELDIAHQLQQNMMPDLPRTFGNYRLDGQILLSSKVGGDFWDLIELNKEESLLVFGDSSGHGLPSALIMSAIRHSLQALSTQIRDYRAFIDPLNRIIYDEFKAKARYATMIFVHLQRNTSKINYLRAGHELLVHRRNGVFQEEDWRGGFPIGLFPEREDDHWVELTLQPGDELYFYTDGITDGLPGHEPKMRQLLNETPGIPGMLVNQTFFQHLTGAYGWRNIDDATLLSLRWQG